ncbi:MULTISPECIES: hypothetical protein [Bacillus]|uniref:hypothetical protein n=1 Tax=Bacillus TaxID=1386 RepID=UPI001B82B868|nr:MULTISPECIES: hypothetical protein [Bacillus]MBR0622137.1 hypothetical protein [Bacillus pumilus]MCW6700279.1 hypothetical protein [Bacillus sp. RP12]
MFQGLTKQDLKQLHKIWRKIKGDITVPHQILVVKGKRELEEIFQASVHFKYTREILQALDHAKSNYHEFTGISMLDDIISHKRIFFNNYR